VLHKSIHFSTISHQHNVISI